MLFVLFVHFGDFGFRDKALVLESYLLAALVAVPEDEEEDCERGLVDVFGGACWARGFGIEGGLTHHR